MDAGEAASFCNSTRLPHRAMGASILQMSFPGGYEWGCRTLYEVRIS